MVERVCSRLTSDLSRYVAEPKGLAALGAKLLLLLRVLGEDQTPGPRFKPGGYRLETLVSLIAPFFDHRAADTLLAGRDLHVEKVRSSIKSGNSQRRFTVAFWRVPTLWEVRRGDGVLSLSRVEWRCGVLSPLWYFSVVVQPCDIIVVLLNSPESSSAKPSVALAPPLSHVFSASPATAALCSSKPYHASSHSLATVS